MRYIALLILPLLAVHARAASLPRPDHIVIVIEENKAYSQIIDNPDAPYINALAKRGMHFEHLDQLALEHLYGVR